MSSEQRPPSKHNFEETLYRLVEQEDSQASAADLKKRLDQDAQFRSSFEQTRKTVISLQGLGPKPSQPKDATFSQRDIEKLTLDILKTYKRKFADLYYELGRAYWKSASETDSFLTRGNKFDGHSSTVFWGTPRMSLEEGKEKLLNSKLAAESIAIGSKYSNRISKFILPKNYVHENLLTPLESALQSFQTSRGLNFKNPLVWSKEAMIFLLLQEQERALSTSNMAEEFIRSPQEKFEIYVNRSVIFLDQGKYQEAKELMQMIHVSDSIYPRSMQEMYIARYNLANCLFLQDYISQAVDMFCDILALTPTIPELREFLTKNLVTLCIKKERKNKKQDFARLIKNISTYLGNDVAIAIEVN